MARLRRAACVLAVFCSFLSIAGYAQLGPVDGATATPIPGAGHNYLQDLVDTVSPADGSVSVRITTPTPSGRGINVPFTFNYDSNGVWQPIYIANGTMGTASNSRYLSSGGWTYGVPRLDLSYMQLETTQGDREIFCPIYTSYSFSDSGGTRHSILADAAPDSSSPCVTLDGRTLNNGGDDLISEYQTPNLGPLYLADPSGTVYNFGVAAHCLVGSSYSSLPSSIEDRNGNLITFAGPPQNCTGVFTVEDTLGRTEISSSGFGASGNTVAISGLQKPYTLTWGTATGSKQVPYTLVDSSQSGCNAFAGGPLGGTTNVISAIGLPNGQSFSFGFDPSYGLLDDIVYPSGATVSYVWEVNPLSAYFQYPSEGPDGEQGPVCEYQYGTFAIAHRFVYSPSNAMLLEQDFTYSTTWNSAGTAWTSKQTTVTTTDKVSGVVSKVTYTYTPISMGLPPYIFNMPQPQVPLENTVVYQDGSGHTLRTDNKSWYDQFELKSDEVTLNGRTSEKTYSYASGAQVSQESDYDFGSGAPGSLIRQVSTNYQAFANSPISSGGSPIFDRPCQVIVYDGGGNRYAETDTYYDNGSTGTPCGTAGTPSVSGAGGSSLTGHDETNYSASSTFSRGNATTVVRQCFQGTTACASGNPTTTYTYDETGQALSMKDPNTNTTSYSYADNFVSTNSSGFTTTAGDPPSGKVTNAYLTKITMPTTSGVAHVEKFAYGYNDGELTESIDQNSQQTTYKYNDSLGRPTQINYPDHGSTNYCYTDTGGSTCSQSGPPYEVVVTKAITSSPLVNETSTIVFDGLGRVSETQLNSDPQGTDFADTTYDGMGQVYTVSNPYRTTSDPTYGLTTYAYDPLGRVTTLTHPDGTSILTSYSGRATEVSDEGNGTSRVQRISQVDGLGRLTSVCEVTSTALVGISGTPAACGQDIAATGFLTSYTYDALGNLLKVAQGGLNGRTYAYDGLSRLTSETNPESGTVKYAYDSAGDLYQRTGPTATTTYTYDALHRITNKAYSDGTPSVGYYYDQSNPWGVGQQYEHNYLGRLTQAEVFLDGNGVAGSVYSYDAMGRIAAEWQCTPRDCGTTSTYFTYTYDLLGDLLTSNNNRDGITYTNSYDGAARPTTLQSSLDDAQHPGTLVTFSNYNAFQRPGTIALGNGIDETLSYTKRDQVYSMGENGTTFYGYNIWNWGNSTFGYAPNGNIVYGNDTANGYWIYTYDDFNRLVKGVCSSSCPPASAFTYTYDRFGNRHDETVTAGTGVQPGYVFTAKNQIDQPGPPAVTYDAAGNMTGDGVGLGNAYTYDAENRIISASNGYTATYVYDAFGHRVRAVVNGEDRDFLYDLSGRTIDQFTSGTLTRTEAYAGGMHVATYVNSTTEFDNSDWLSTVRVRTDVTGNKIESCTSLPFGEDLTCTGTEDSPLHFTGKERDSESGLDYFGRRHYASTMGRWMTPDPINLTKARLVNPGNTLNKYVYGANNPLKYIDRDGEDITIFYRPPSGASGDYGHIMLGALNQATGKVGFLDYYPAGNVNGLGQGPGAFNTGNMSERAAQNADGKFATLTIQTSPEEAQKVLNLIDALKNGSTPDYSALTNNCTTVCEDVLQDLGLDFGDVFPSSYWADVYNNFSADAQAHPIWTRMMGVHGTPGNEYGNPRNYGGVTNFSQWLFTLYQNQQQQPQPKACVEAHDSSGQGTGTTCN